MSLRKLALVARMCNRRCKMREKKAVALAIIGITVLATFATLATFPVFAEEPIYEYLIITTEPLSDEFQVLADWKALWVNGAIVHIVDPDANDDDIKAVIEDYYDNHGTRYVLLGGDAGYPNEIIPYHLINFNFRGDITPIAEDYWFANLDGDEEISEYEVYIGRAPVDNEAQAAHFVKKVILFEQMDKPKANLFHSSYLIVKEDWALDGRELANQCMQYVPPDYANYTLFEELNPPDPVTEQEYHDFWHNDGIMCVHYGHGAGHQYQINFGGQTMWDGVDVHNLNNAFWPIHTSIACGCGNFAFGDCIAETYVKADNGAIACFMNHADGLPPVGDEFIEMQFKALYENGYQNIGAILAESKHELINKSNQYDDYNYTWREINLIGDPETPVLTKRVRNLNLTVLAKDQNGTNLATVDVYIDGQWHGLTGSTGLTFTVSPGHEVSVNDFWESGDTRYRYNFTDWEDNSTDKTRTITFFENTTITAYFKKSGCACPGDVNGDKWVNSEDYNILAAAYGTWRGATNWNSAADINADSWITSIDFAILGGNYGWYYQDA